jgi:hypothetical protein
VILDRFHGVKRFRHVGAGRGRWGGGRSSSTPTADGHWHASPLLALQATEGTAAGGIGNGGRKSARRTDDGEQHGSLWIRSAGRVRGAARGHRLRKLVHDLLMKRLLDAQFEESGRTLTELHQIEGSLGKSMIALHHARIKYPEAKLRGASWSPVS